MNFNTPTEKKHANIPIFIPHEGCPNGCVFCSQKKITGSDERADRNIIPEIEQALSTLDPEKYDTEIAFFGGSFTGIDRAVMERLLKDAYSFIKSGRVSSIRLSTRPDYINEEILGILKNYGVVHIELGIQSSDNAVLQASKRGHTAETSLKACEMIVNSGFVLGGQMMIGLPKSTLKSEIDTAKMICSAGASESRIYPTVVFRHTELCSMAQSGSYIPLSNDEAAVRAAECYKIFMQNGVKVLRVGLQSSENLHCENDVYGGANHPAMGELCESKVYYGIILDRVSEILSSYRGEKTLILECPYRDISKVSGQKKENKKALLLFLNNKGVMVKNIKLVGIFDEAFKINARFAD